MNAKNDASIRAARAALSDAVTDAFLLTARGQRCSATLGEGPALQLLRDVFEHISANLGGLTPTRKHAARQLYGTEAWAAFQRPRLRNCAGMCLAFLVTARLLPLQLHKTRSGKGSRHYWLRPQRDPSATAVPTTDDVGSAARHEPTPGL